MKGHKIFNAIFFFIRLCVSCFFLFISIKKVLEINKLQGDIEKFDVFPVSWSIPFSYLGVACEIIIALGLLWRKTYAGAAMLGCLMTSMFIALFAQGWAREIGRASCRERVYVLV